MATSNLNFTITANAASAQAAVSQLSSALNVLVRQANVTIVNNNTFNNITTGASTAAKSVSTLGAAFQELGKIALAYAGFSAIKHQLDELGNAIITQQSAMSRLRFANDNDLKKAADDYAFLREQAERLGQPLATITGSFGNLAAATKGTALSGAATKQIFLGVAEAATVLKLSADDTKGALLALQQMVSKGKVSAEEFRQQLGERVPVALEAGAKALGVTRTAFAKLLDNGEINSETFLPKFAEELRKLAKDALPAATQSFIASKNRLENAVLELRQNVGEGPLGTKLQESIDGVTKSLRDPNLVSGLQLLGVAFAKVAEFAVTMFAKVNAFTKMYGTTLALTASDIVAGFSAVVPIVTQIFNSLMSAIKRAYASSLEAFAKGAGALGNNGLSEALYDTATSVRQSADSNVKAAADAKKALQSVIQFNKDRKKAIYDNSAADLIAPLSSAGKSLTPDITNLDKVKTAPKDNKAEAKKEATALEAYLKAYESYAIENAKTIREKAQADLDAALAMRLISQRDYLQEKAKLDQAEIAQEVQARTERASTLQLQIDNPKTSKAERLKASAELVKVQSELNQLDGKAARVSVKLETDLYVNDKAVKDLKAELENQLRDITGGTAGAATARLAKETADQLADPRVIDSGLGPLILQLEEAKKRLIDLGEASRQANLVVAQLGFTEANIQRSITTGAISEMDGQRKIREERLKAAEAMRSQVVEAERLAALTGDPAQVQQAMQLRQTYEDLAATMDQTAVDINKTFFGSIEEGFKDLATGAKSFGEVLRNVVGSVLAQLAQISLNNFLSGLAGSGGGAAGGLGGLLSGMLAFADGGAVRGPGTGTSDSILARLSNGEHVITAAAARAIGTPTLDYINRKGALPAFSTGGAVMQGFGGPTTVDNAINVQPRVTLATSEVIAALRGDPEFERFHVELSIANRRRINKG